MPTGDDLPMPPAGLPRWKFDWADLVVPLVASLGLVIKAGKSDPVQILGGGIGFALMAALLFTGVRHLLWAVNRRLAQPRPREPLLAAIVGILFWGWVVLHR